MIFLGSLRSTKLRRGQLYPLIEFPWFSHGENYGENPEENGLFDYITQCLWWPFTFFSLFNAFSQWVSVIKLLLMTGFQWRLQLQQCKDTNSLRWSLPDVQPQEWSRLYPEGEISQILFIIYFIVGQGVKYFALRLLYMLTVKLLIEQILSSKAQEQIQV